MIIQEILRHFKQKEKRTDDLFSSFVRLFLELVTGVEPATH
jgi:hypothetical protein|nr:MAG TPA: hypothetical protein [Caudoviricetes sp.]